MSCSQQQTMKWGKRKTSSPSSSRPTSISPFSWLSKFKRMSIDSGPDPAKLKQKVKKHSPSVGAPQYGCRNGGRFDDDDFWRVSFSKEGDYNMKNTDILKFLWDNSDDDQHFVPSSTCCKRHGGREGSMKFKEKDTGLREGRKLPKDMEISMEMDEYDRDMELDQKVQRVLQEQLLKLQRDAEKAEFASVEKDVLKFESARRIWTPRTHSSSPCVDSKNSRQRAIREDTSEKKVRQNLKQIEKLKSKTEKERKSLHVSRELQRRKPKHSPKDSVQG